MKHFYSISLKKFFLIKHGPLFLLKRLISAIVLGACGTDVPARPKSARSRASSEAEPLAKLQKKCHAHRYVKWGLTHDRVHLFALLWVRRL